MTARKRSATALLAVGLAIMTGCSEQPANFAAANANQLAGPTRARPSAEPKIADREDLINNVRVLESYRREAYDHAWASVCVLPPQLDHIPGAATRVRELARARAARTGVSVASIDCGATGPDSTLGRYPELLGGANRGAGRTRGHGETPFSRFESSLQVYPVVVEAACNGVVTSPARPQAAARMRWAGPIRLSVPDRPALRAAFRDLLADPALRSALGGIEISLVDRDPNVLVRGWHEALLCPEQCGNSLDPVESMVPVGPSASDIAPGACGSQVPLRKREGLAREISGDRLSYLRDGVDFRGQRPNAGRSGFFLADRGRNIRGGVCLIHDGFIDSPAVPAIYRQVLVPPNEAVAACLLGILGIDVSAADAADLSPLNQNRLAPWAVEALGQLYRPPPAARRDG